MNRYGIDEDGLHEYLKFHKIFIRCYKQADTSTAPELVDLLVLPTPEEVGRGLRTRVDDQEINVMPKPGEVVSYNAGRNPWDRTRRVLHEDDSVRECILRACSELDLKKIPLMILIKVIQPMRIFPPEEIAAAIAAQVLLMYSQLDEKLEDLDVEEHGVHPQNPRTDKTSVSSRKSPDHLQNCNPFGEDSSLSQCDSIEWYNRHSSTEHGSLGTDASVGNFGEMDDKAVTRKQGLSSIGSADDEDVGGTSPGSSILSEYESIYGSSIATRSSEYESANGGDILTNDISWEDETNYESREPTADIIHKTSNVSDIITHETLSEKETIHESGEPTSDKSTHKSTDGSYIISRDTLSEKETIYESGEPTSDITPKSTDGSDIITHDTSSEKETIYESGEPTSGITHKSTDGSDIIAHDTPLENETIYESGVPTSGITHKSTDQECAYDEKMKALPQWTRLAMIWIIQIQHSDLLAAIVTTHDQCEWFYRNFFSQMTQMREGITAPFQLFV